MSGEKKQDTAPPPEVQLALQAKKKRRTRTARIPRAKGAVRIEEQYARGVGKIFGEIREAIREGLLKQLPSIIRQAELERPRADSKRLDDYLSELRGLFRATRASVGRLATNKLVRSLTEQVSNEVKGLSENNIKSAFKASIDVGNISGGDAFVDQQIEVFIENNANLIENVKEELLTEVERTVSEGIRRGERFEDIANKILARAKDKEGFRGRFKKAETRAKFIARDQVNKLNGALNQARQESLGVKKYIWRTAKDDRVRDAHQLEGAVFEWGKNTGVSANGRKVSKPRGSLNPGEDFNCRCYAEPYIEDLIDS